MDERYEHYAIAYYIFLFGIQFNPGYPLEPGPRDILRRWRVHPVALGWPSALTEGIPLAPPPVSLVLSSAETPPEWPNLLQLQLCLRRRSFLFDLRLCLRCGSRGHWS